MRTRNAVRQTLRIIHPFADEDDVVRVYKLPDRGAAAGAQRHIWPYGARLGPTASGHWSNLVEGKDQPPLHPLLRKVNWRELLRIVQSHRQIGLPTSVNADAGRGWAPCGYMAVEISMNRCLGARRILLRVLGTCSKGSEAPKNNLPQRAKCGVCPCCVRATHVLIPATYEAGTHDRRTNNAAKLWQVYGHSQLRGSVVFYPIRVRSVWAELDCRQARGYAPALSESGGSAK